MYDAKIQPAPSMMDSFYSNCIRIAEKWSKPEGEQFTRIHLIGVSLLSLANTVTQVFFSICSLIPGSDSDWVRDTIDVEGWARDGFEFGKDIHKGRSYSAQLILPSLFKAVALTLNPYATIKQPKFGELEKVKCYSYFLFEKARESAKKGKSMEDIYESSGNMQDLVMAYGTEYIKNSDDDEMFFNENDYVETRFNFESEKISTVSIIEQEEAPEVEAKAEAEVEVEESKAEWEKWVIKEIGTRALYLIATLAIVVEKTVYIAAGVLFAACALGLGFKFSKVNLLAMEYLGALDVIDDVRSGVLGMVSPDKFSMDHHQRILDTPKKVKFR